MATHKSKKRHFLALKSEDDGVYFESTDGYHQMYWAGGGKDKINYVLQACMAIYGNEEGADIYSKFNEALATVSDPVNAQPGIGKLGVMVQYPKRVMRDNSFTNE